MSLNPTKISGVCGRLMCCLKFEEDHYEATRKRMPKMGKEVETSDGFGTVVDLNVLKETVTVRINKGDGSEYKAFPLEDVKWAKPQQPMGERAPRPQDNRQPVPAKRSRAKRPAISSNLDEPSAMVDEPELNEGDLEEAMRPVEQENDWRKAVEDALNAAGKQ